MLLGQDFKVEYCGQELVVTATFDKVLQERDELRKELAFLQAELRGTIKKPKVLEHARLKNGT